MAEKYDRYEIGAKQHPNCRCKAYTSKTGWLYRMGNACCSGAMCVCPWCPMSQQSKAKRETMQRIYRNITGPLQAGLQKRGIELSEEEIQDLAREIVDAGEYDY